MEPTGLFAKGRGRGFVYEKVGRQDGARVATDATRALTPIRSVRAAARDRRFLPRTGGYGCPPRINQPSGHSRRVGDLAASEMAQVLGRMAPDRIANSELSC
jgi:hypothetical protein